MSQHAQGTTPRTARVWPAAGEKMIVIQDDEGIVKKTVVDMLHEVGKRHEFWDSRGLWREKAGTPDWTKVQHRIEEMEAELEDLRAEHMETLEQLT